MLQSKEDSEGSSSSFSSKAQCSEVRSPPFRLLGGKGGLLGIHEEIIVDRRYFRRFSRRWVVGPARRRGFFIFPGISVSKSLVSACCRDESVGRDNFVSFFKKVVVWFEKFREFFLQKTRKDGHLQTPRLQIYCHTTQTKDNTDLYGGITCLGACK